MRVFINRQIELINTRLKIQSESEADIKIDEYLTGKKEAFLLLLDYIEHEEDLKQQHPQIFNDELG